eukprot:TRINITY_DN103761_c0_g1_i1.p1 TRINITY_DN103761_c0_g1~~TRINITY_DN103761_c0_g1_i1.p1  ORF type:complete len:391 (+),score=76.12 TRINITY_DN103761_c0_g1_i1:69-1241(+)
MGIDFRGGNYVRRVRIGKRTVKDGEAVAIWDQYGRHHQVIGPARCRLWWSTIRFLERHVAESTDYLRVRHRDGTVEHVRGPTVLFENPVYHLGVSVEKAIQLQNSSSHLAVQHGPAVGKEGGGTSQEIVSGPLLFFPEATDTVVGLKWADEGGGALSNSGRVINVGATITRSLACDVQGADSHSATVHIHLRVRLVGIKEALTVRDPIGECDAVAKAAVLGTTQGMRFSQLSSSVLEQVRAAVSDAKFTSLITSELRQRAACELVGITVGTVQPSSELKKILNQEDELAAAKVKDQIADGALDAASARQQREQALELAKQKHELKMAAERHQAALGEHDLEARRHLDHLKELRDMGVDLTEYLCHGPRSQMIAASAKGDHTLKPMRFLCL